MCNKYKNDPNLLAKILFYFIATVTVNGASEWFDCFESIFKGNVLSGITLITYATILHMDKFSWNCLVEDRNHKARSFIQKGQRQISI